MLHDQFQNTCWPLKLIVDKRVNCFTQSLNEFHFGKKMYVWIWLLFTSIDPIDNCWLKYCYYFQISMQTIVQFEWLGLVCYGNVTRGHLQQLFPGNRHEKANRFSLLIVRRCSEMTQCYQSGTAACTLVGFLQVACKSFLVWQMPKLHFACLKCFADDLELHIIESCTNVNWFSVHYTFYEDVNN